MRFIISELSYETPLVAGRFHYFRNGQPTGALESWRLTEAAEGYRFLRVDLDAREAPSGDSALFHMVLNALGRPERLSFRVFRPGYRLRGNVLFEQTQLTLSLEVNGERRDQELPIAAAAAFWFPATMGLSLLASLSADGSATPVVTLDKEDDFALFSTTLAVEAGEKELLSLPAGQFEAWPRTLRWAEQERTIWLDAEGRLLQAQRRDLVARQTRYLSYGRA